MKPEQPVPEEEGGPSLLCRDKLPHAGGIQLINRQMGGLGLTFCGSEASLMVAVRIADRVITCGDPLM